MIGGSRVVKSRAQSLVEFALILPILIFLITAFLDLGRAVYYYVALSNAVREGARAAVVMQVGTTTTEQNAYRTAIQNKVIEKAIALESAKLTVTVTLPTKATRIVQVAGSYIFDPITPGVKQILGAGNTITLSSQSAMQVAPLVKLN